MYCGDEVYSVIADVGTQISKFGYGGNDSPCCVFTSAIGGRGPIKRKRGQNETDPVSETYCIADTALGLRSADLHLSYAIEDGHVKDYDVLASIWRHAFDNSLTLKEKSTIPLLYSISPWATHDECNKLLELAYEDFGFGAVYLARSAMLSAFSTGRASALVCDCGAGSTSAIPLLDGHMLKTGSRRSPRGGRWLDQHVDQYLQSQGISVNALRGQSTDPAVSTSLLHSRRQIVLQDVKKSCCYIPQLPSEDESLDGSQGLADRECKEYELPDGTKVEVGDELAHIPELLMLPALGNHKPSSGPSAAEDLPGLAHAAVEASDCDVRRELLGNIVLTGGGSLFPGTAERLHSELTERVPSAYKVKVVAATPLERRFGAWIGGSILASLGSFQQLWLSRQEFAELGADRACRERFH